MITAYVIVPTEWEYNDSEYYAVGYGVPKAVYLNQEMAERTAHQMTLDDARSLEIWNYGETYNRNHLDEDLLVEVFGKKEPNYDDYVLETASDESIIELLDLMDLTFYEVHKIEIHTEIPKTCENGKVLRPTHIPNSLN